MAFNDSLTGFSYEGHGAPMRARYRDLKPAKLMTVDEEGEKRAKVTRKSDRALR